MQARRISNRIHQVPAGRRDKGRRNSGITVLLSELQQSPSECLARRVRRYGSSLRSEPGQGKTVWVDAVEEVGHALNGSSLDFLYHEGLTRKKIMVSLTGEYTRPGTFPWIDWYTADYAILAII